MKKIIIILILPFTIALISSFKSVSKNTFTIGNQSWGITSAVIANESYDIKSKYELDLINDKTEISDAKTFIYLSITSGTTTKLTDGLYHFSSSSLNNRAPYHFNGSIYINGKEIKISDGSFSIYNQKDEIEVQFILKLENGDIANGSYSGKTFLTNRSSNYK